MRFLIQNEVVRESRYNLTIAKNNSHAKLMQNNVHEWPICIPLKQCKQIHM